MATPTLSTSAAASAAGRGPPDPRHRDALPPVRALCAVVRRLNASIAPLPHVVGLISQYAVSWTIDRACAFPNRLPLLGRLRDRERKHLLDPYYRDLVTTRGLAAAAGRGDLETVKWLGLEYASRSDRLPWAGPAESVTDAVEAAAAGGHWDVLEWLEHRYNSVRLGILEMELAAGNGCVDVLDRLHARLEPVGRSWRRPERVNDLFRCLRAAANGGHLAIVQSLATHIYVLERNRGQAAPREFVLSMQVPATNGHLHVLQWMHEAEHPRFHLTPSIGSLWRAAQNGHLAVAKWLYEIGVSEDGAKIKAIDKAAANGHLDMVCWLHSTGKFAFTAEAMNSAALNGHFTVVRWLHEHWSNKSDRALHAMDNAAANGHLDILKFLHAHRQDGCSTAAMDSAAANGHLDVVKWLNENRSEGCTTHAMDGAAANGHLQIAQWLMQYGHEGCTTKAMDGAAANGRLDMVRWLEENRSEGCTPDAMDGAAASGHLHVVKWLHDHRTEGCTTRAMDDAAANGHLRVVKWLHENRREGCTTRAMDDAARNAHFPVLLFLQSRRCEGCSKLAFASAFLNSDLHVLRWLVRHYPKQFNRQYALRQHGADAVRPFVVDWAVHDHWKAELLPSLRCHGVGVPS